MPQKQFPTNRQSSEPSLQTLRTMAARRHSMAKPSETLNRNHRAAIGIRTTGNVPESGCSQNIYRIVRPEQILINTDETCISASGDPSKSVQLHCFERLTRRPSKLNKIKPPNTQRCQQATLMRQISNMLPFGKPVTTRPDDRSGKHHWPGLCDKALESPRQSQQQPRLRKPSTRQASTRQCPLRPESGQSPR